MSERVTVVPLEQVLGIEIKCHCGMEWIVSTTPDEPDIIGTCPNPKCKSNLATARLAAKSFREFHAYSTAFMREGHGRDVAVRIRIAGMS